MPLGWSRGSAVLVVSVFRVIGALFAILEVHETILATGDCMPRSSDVLEATIIKRKIEARGQEEDVRLLDHSRRSAFASADISTVPFDRERLQPALLVFEHPANTFLWMFANGAEELMDGTRQQPGGIFCGARDACVNNRWR
jgi:hypothetical protein